jgi:hypothetical protein
MRKQFKVMLLLYLAVLLIYSIPNLSAISEADVSKCTTSGYPVCLSRGVTLSVKYGTLTPLYDAAFQWFGVYANGTIFFDVSQLAPSPDPAIQFTAQSYGNGTFDIRFKGPPAQGIITDGSYLLSATGGWGSGAEITYTTNTPRHTLIVNYAGRGPGCPFFCSNALPPYFPFIVLVALIVAIGGITYIPIRLPFRKGQHPALGNER